MVAWKRPVYVHLCVQMACSTKHPFSLSLDRETVRDFFVKESFFLPPLFSFSFHKLWIYSNSEITENYITKLSFEFQETRIYIYIYSKKDRLYYVSWFFKVEQTIYLSVENQKYSFHYLSLMHLFIDHVKISLALIYVYIYITVNDIFIYI